MSEHASIHPVSRIIFLCAAIVFIVWGISQAQAVLVMPLVSLFFAVLATPAVLWLSKKYVPSVIAVLIVTLTMIIILLAITVVVGTSISSFYSDLPTYQARIEEQVNTLKAFLNQKGIAVPETLWLNFVNPQAVMSLTAGLFMRLGSVFSNIILIVLTVTFILLEVTSFPIKLRSVLGDPHQAFPQFTRFIDDMKRYMVIKTLMSLATGILVTLWLLILQIDYPFLWGFLAFLLNYIPTLGSTVAAIPAVLIALMQSGLWWAVLLAAGCIVINFTLDYGIEKRLMGRELGLSTLVVFLSLVLWGSLLGPIGAVLCIPLTMTLKFAFESCASTRWIAVLLGPESRSEGFV